MANRTTKKHFKLRHNKPIGTVVFVVEGTKDEFDLIYKIFHKLLHYKIIAKKRQDAKPKLYDSRTSKANVSSQVVVINTENSNIQSIQDHTNYRNEVYKSLVKEYKIDPKNAPVYYIWDRDRSSNPSTQVRNLVARLGSAYDNTYDENGLLLLSYPAVEAYKMSCRAKSYKKSVMASVKRMKHSLICRIQPTDTNKIIYATEVMHQVLVDLGIMSDCHYNTENFGKTNQAIFRKQEEIYKKQHGYRVLSLLTIALIDLGIIEID